MTSILKTNNIIHLRKHPIYFVFQGLAGGLAVICLAKLLLLYRWESNFWKTAALIFFALIISQVIRLFFLTKKVSEKQSSFKKASHTY